MLEIFVSPRCKSAPRMLEVTPAKTDQPCGEVALHIAPQSSYLRVLSFAPLSDPCQAASRPSVRPSGRAGAAAGPLCARGAPLLKPPKALGARTGSKKLLGAVRRQRLGGRSGERRGQTSPIVRDSKGKRRSERDAPFPVASPGTWRCPPAQPPGTATPLKTQEEKKS